MGCRAEQRLPTVVDPAGIGTNESADRVEERRLAGAVRSDDGDDLTRLDTKGNLIQRQDPPEADGEVDNLEGRPRKLSHPFLLPNERSIRHYPLTLGQVKPPPLSSRDRSPSLGARPARRARRGQPPARDPARRAV